MPFDFELSRSPLSFYWELGQESQLGTAGPAPTGNPLPTTPLQVHHLALLPRQFSFLLCVVYVLGLHPLLPPLWIRTRSHPQSENDAMYSGTP